MDTIDRLIELRILINSVCDGFSCDNLNKNLSLNAKTKILFLLRDKDMCPSDMIKFLGVAKTNLANILRSMIEERTIVSYKNIDNSKNIFYRITNDGLKEVKDYKDKLLLSIKDYKIDDKLTESIDNIIHFLKGENK